MKKRSKEQGRTPNSRSTRIDSEKAAEAKVEEALRLLQAVGVPLQNKTPRMQRRMARIFLAVANLEPTTPWSEAAVWRDDKSWALGSRQIIKFLNKHYGERLADSSYDDIYRENMIYLVETGLILTHPARPAASPTDSRRNYAVNRDAASLLKNFGTSDWEKLVEVFKAQYGNLDEALKRKRKRQKVAPALPKGVEIHFHSDPHDQLQRMIFEEFLPYFVPDAELLYVGDVAPKKERYHQKDRLEELKFPEIARELFPDIIAYDKKQNWLYLIEAVHSSNPLSPIRHHRLEKKAKNCRAEIIYVSAFRNRKSFAKWVAEISWETEVWLADSPDHLIHFNGDKYLGPHRRRQ